MSQLSGQSDAVKGSTRYKLLRFGFSEYTWCSFYRFRREELLREPCPDPDENSEPTVWLPVLPTKIKYCQYSVNSGNDREIGRHRNYRGKSCHIYLLRIYT